LCRDLNYLGRAVMHPKLAKPPLIESVCELRVDPNLPWDLTIPGRLFEKLKSVFPEKRQTLGLELKLGPQGIAEEPDYRQIDNLQFLSQDGKNVVQIREHLLSVSRLAPYEAWEKYKPSVLDVFEQFGTIAGDATIARAGLKYVNRIVIPRADFKLEEYFDIYPYLGPKLPQSHGPFLVGVIFPFDGVVDSLRAEITSANPEGPDQYNILFSLDYFTTTSQRVTFHKVGEWLETAHDRIEDTFHATLTEAAMKLFE
jgi:uncharacterized protein (TIGR04255 family)